VQALAIDIIERIAFFVVKAPKQAVDQLGPFLCGELQRFRDDLLSIGRHITSLRSRGLLDKSDFASACEGSQFWAEFDRLQLARKVERVMGSQRPSGGCSNLLIHSGRFRPP
jgi:hypothetical protein